MSSFTRGEPAEAPAAVSAATGGSTGGLPNAPHMRCVEHERATSLLYAVVAAGFDSLSAVRIRCGCSGRLRIVTPVALRTAFAIAAAVGTVGGSPTPMMPRFGWSMSRTSTGGMSDIPANRLHVRVHHLSCVPIQDAILEQREIDRPYGAAYTWLSAVSLSTTNPQS